MTTDPFLGYGVCIYELLQMKGEGGRVDI